MRLHVEALQYLDPSMPRERWVRICFAFKDAGGAEEEWLAWCEAGANFQRADALSTFRNAKAVPGGVTAATLFMEARKDGWKPSTPMNPAPPPRARAPSAAPPAGESSSTPPESAPPAQTGTPVDPARLWERAVPAVGHEYLTRKGIAAHGARVDAHGWLLVPYVDANARLRTIQRINSQGVKKFSKGTRQKGSVAVVGEARGAGVVAICEGFATACAVNEATGYAAVAAGSRGLLPDAARMARAWAPDARLVICADVGDMASPIRAARAVDARLAVPGAPDAADGFDFCDWRQAGASPSEIRARLDHAPPPAPAKPAPEDGAVMLEPATDAVSDALASVEGMPAAEPARYSRDAKGRIVSNLDNVVAALKSGALGPFALDTFTGLRTWNGAPVGDNELGRITCLLQRVRVGAHLVFPKVAITMVADAIEQAASACAFNSNVQFLEALGPWDGVERIAHFLPDVCGIEATSYTMAASRYLWLALTMRMVQPGCKADLVPVLIGAQGIGKSTLGQIIGAERYGQITLLHMGERDWYTAIRGKVLVEFSELSGHSRAELETMKAVITSQVDEYRPAYARTAQSVPRGCLFYGTTNEADFLIDSSGNRRWLPVQCRGPLDLTLAQQQRAQCFAEAFAIVQGGNAGAYWLVPDAPAQQAAHVARDPWIDLLAEKLRDVTGVLPDQVDTNRVYEALKIPAERQSGGGTGRRISAVMCALGYERARWYQGEGHARRQIRGFTLPAETVEDSSAPLQN